jgi:hypothetical protein
MKIVRTALLASTLAITSLFAANPLDEAMSADGLKKANVKGLDLVYTLPEASLSAYKKVKLDPVDVTFRKDWKPDRPGSRLKMSTGEIQAIRDGVAKIVHDEYAKAITKAGFPLVNEAGPDVLQVKAKVLNLYVNAPDTKQAGVKTFTVSSGEMTLLAELSDSETGQILARAVDREEGRNTGMIQMSNSVMNAGDAQMIAAKWANILANALVKARGGEPKK